nr:hypothetical protein [uncultured Romboutsia sp.]
MNRKYNLKLDLQFRCNNSIMKFNQFDNNTSDFFMRITNGGNLVDVEKAIVVLAVIKPSGKVASQFVEVKNGLVYADLKPSMKDEIGTYAAQAMLILEDERVVTDVISYEVEEDKIFSLLNDTVETSEEFTLLTDMLSRLSTIEISEEQRIVNEAERILSEENRKIEEAKRVEAELIRQHEEADRSKYDATRESNENIRKQNESTRLANETNRIDEEAKRVEEENKRKLAEEERNANYNFMTEDEERRRLEANAHKEAENLRAQAENTRVNEEAKRRTTEQARVLAENTRVSNENTRKANEETRQNNETHRVEAETQRQNRYNSFIVDAEANASNFENYTNTAKVKEEERKSNELDRKSQEARRVSNEVERISNENTRKANEKAREKNETSRQYVFENKVDEVDKKIIEINATKDNFVSSINTKVDTKISELNTTKDNFVSSVNTKVDSKISELDNTKSDMATSINNKVNEVENRFNALTSKQQQDAEVIDARDGETSLKARLDRDIEKAKQVYVDVEGSHISSDSSVGYAKDVEILGNTVQSASNLADIRSVGDKVEGQELYEIPVLSVGKNIWNTTISIFNNNKYLCTPNYSREVGVKLPKNSSWTLSFEKITRDARVYIWGGNNSVREVNPNVSNKVSFTLNGDEDGISFYAGNFGNSPYDEITTDFKIQLEEGTVATPYEPYQEDKLTILSPVQIEKVGDVRDRIIERDGVWGVEKHIKTDLLKGGGNEDFRLNKVLDKGGYQFTWFANMGAIANKNSEVISSTMNSYVGSNEEYSSNIWIYNGITYVIHHPTISTKDEIKLWLQANPTIVKFASNTPQFIPLSHDQQVKLRTFANKTNISFLTEIEGTIKAQVPKSIGATVNTHTEQISNLNKELDRVKKLEESTVSTVTTESDFTAVEATSNGYFEDVKLEGKTLVNYISNFNNWSNMGSTTVSEDGASMTINATSWNKGRQISKSLPSGEYIFSINNPNNATIIVQNKTNAKTLLMGNNIDMNIKFSLLEVSEILITCKNTSETGTYVVNNPILTTDKNVNGYFEGLKSVGQSASEDGADEIVVSSMEKNIVKYTKKIIKSDGYACDFEGISSNDVYYHNLSDKKIRLHIKNNNTYVGNITIHPKTSIQYELSDGNVTYAVTLTSDYGWEMQEYDIDRIFAITRNNQSDKKRLLYYNNETQTWEKPILREWDSIEKHANGKYYYHQRSGEVVLNGSENWNNDTNSSTMSPATYRQSIQFDAIDIPSASFNTKTSPNIISDLLPTVIFGDVYSHNHIGISISGTDSIGTHIIINNNFIDVTELKQWLQTSNLTLVYQLAEEKVYECTNIDLITYANETNFIVESGALSPKTTLKVHSNISNVVSLLQKKVSLLESNIKASQEVQDMMILETDMRMLDIELALMEFIPMTLNLGGSNMLRSATYFNFLKNHIINETYEKEYLENVMNKYLATGRINQDEYNELYKMLYPPVYDIELPIEY